MKKLSLLFAAFVISGAVVDAQTILTPTTLSAAVADANIQNVVVASATGFAAGNVMFIDRELMSIESVNGTTIHVQRGASGTVATAHASGSYVFQGAPNLFYSKAVPIEKGGSCTRSKEQVIPYVNVQTGVISDCIGGSWVNGYGTGAETQSRFRVYSPEPGGTAYTSLNSTGTTLSATTLYCTETFLPSNKLLTGAAVLAGTAVATDKWYMVLYDSSGNALANSAVAGTTTATASTYQQQAFTSKYFAVGPADYFVCFQTNGTTDTARMAVTGVNDNILTKGQTGATFGTIPSLTVPTTFTTAVGPYVYLY